MRVFQPQRTDDPQVNRNIDGIANNLRDLSSIATALGIGGGSVSYPTTARTVDREALVVFRGDTAATITLPGALSLGNGIFRQLIIWNDSAVALTIAVGTGDRVSGSTTVAAGAWSIWISDGAAAWGRVL